MKNTLLLTTRYLILVVFGLSLVGCATTKKRYEKGVDLESQGRYAEAARHYIDVLKRDSDWEGAADRLAVVGAQAIDTYLEEAETAERARQFERATNVLSRLDALRREAQAVGVSLAVPANYATYQDRLEDQAIAALVERGETAEQQNDWREALKAYNRLQDRYELPATQQRSIQEAKVRVHTRWAQQLLAQENYREAFDRAQTAVDLLSPDHSAVQAAIKVQDEAVAAGTRYVAHLPLWQTEQVARTIPRGFLEALNDDLMLDYWTNPPLFLASVDPVAVRRELRRLRFDRTLITRSQAVEIGRVLETDYVVVAELTGYESSERDAKERRRTVKTKGRNALDTAFVEVEFVAELSAEIEYRVIDTASRERIGERRIRAKVNERFKRGRYAGNPDDLDLSSRQRRLFDTQEHDEAERALEEALIDDLAAQLASAANDMILQRID